MSRRTTRRHLPTALRGDAATLSKVADELPAMLDALAAAKRAAASPGSRNGPRSSNVADPTCLAALTNLRRPDDFDLIERKLIRSLGRLRRDVAEVDALRRALLAEPERIERELHPPRG